MTLHTVDGRNPANPLRLVVYPILLPGFSTIPGGFLAGFLNHGSPHPRHIASSICHGGRRKTIDGDAPTKEKCLLVSAILIGGFNPFETYESKCESPAPQKRNHHLL